MPLRFIRHDLCVMRLVSCALTALLTAFSTHAQTPAAPTKPSAAKVSASAAPSTPTPPAVKTPAPAAKTTATPASKPPVVVAALSPADEVKKTFKDKIVPFVKTYCYECHGDKRMKGGVTFHPALKNPADPAYSRRWKMGLATVHAHDMPPDEADTQPTDAEREEFMTWVGRLKFLSPKDPGAFVIRRLTKVEYGNTLHDLLGVDPDIVKELPDEVPGEGYLNTLSSLQMEQYLGIANDALSHALAPSGAPPTDVQLRLLGTNPAPGTDVKAAARMVARTLARSAYRRPPTEHELDVLLQVFDLAMRSKLSYPEALRLMLKAVLVSPQFLYITPATEAPPASEIVSLDDWMLASRLSYLLWATMPDAELSSLADQGKLSDPAVLQSQTKRMLLDSRSRALFDGFGAQWLGLADLADKTFDTTKFPQMTPELRTAMYDEVRLFFDSIVRKNRSVVTFINADYAFINEPLAAIYSLSTKSTAEVQNKSSSSSRGSAVASSLANDSRAGNLATASAPSITGPQLRQVKLTDPNRGGILGMPGILAVTSFPNRTSPVKRGVWVLEQILGQHVPPAPPNVPTLEKQDKTKIANLTLRQRTELHRTNVVCANCHKILDPIGFGLENFDAIGRWRTQDDTGGPIDAAGELPGGKRFSTPAELKAIIAARKDDLARNLTEKLLAYALCRQLEGYDEIVIDQLMQGIIKDRHSMQSLITAVVTSYPFTHRRIVETLSGPAAPAATKAAVKK